MNFHNRATCLSESTDNGLYTNKNGSRTKQNKMAEKYNAYAELEQYIIPKTSYTTTVLIPDKENSALHKCISQF